MKSNPTQLFHRGYLSEGAELEYTNSSLEECIQLLQSDIPSKRTLGARLIAGSKEKEAVEPLINALKAEKKLYSKLEICSALVAIGTPSIRSLIQILGQLGNNQHKLVPEKEFKKDSYPLPRDIAARTLIRLGQEALPDLLTVLERGSKKQLSEAIDAIGFICFYDYMPGIYSYLQRCWERNKESQLIQWKLVRAMSAFPESELFLQELLHLLENNRMQSEIKRSLALIDKRTYRFC